MKRKTIRLVTLLCALPVSGTVMAHGGHEEAAGSVLHGLYHLIVTSGLPMVLAIGLVAVLFLGRSSIGEVLRRITDRN